MTEEIYEDVLKEEPQPEEIKGKLFYNTKKENKFSKRLHNSIGWVEPETVRYKQVDEKGNSWQGAEIKEEVVWEVTLGKGQFFTCEKQIEAELLAYVAQINERLKRVENQVNKLSEKKPQGYDFTKRTERYLNQKKKQNK